MTSNRVHARPLACAFHSRTLFGPFRASALLTAALALALGMSASRAAADIISAGEINTYIYNYDLINNTGQTAHGMQWRLDPPVVASDIETVFEFPPPNYPDSQVFSGDFDAPTIVWSGNTTDPGGSAHFGVESKTEILSGVANWLDENDVPLAPGYSSVLPDWDLINRTGGAGAVLAVRLANPTSDTFWIQRRTNAWPDTLSLNDLQVGLPPDEGARPVDINLQPLLPGETLSQTLALDSDYKGYLLAFDLFEDVGGPGRQIGTFLNAVNVTPIPEPASSALLSIGLAAAWWSRARRRGARLR